MCSSEALSDFECHWCIVTHKCGIKAKSCGAEPWMVMSLLLSNTCTFVSVLHILLSASNWLYLDCGNTGSLV